jgi:hypothetical protein
MRRIAARHARAKPPSPYRQPASRSSTPGRRPPPDCSRPLPTAARVCIPASLGSPPGPDPAVRQPGRREGWMRQPCSPDGEPEPQPGAAGSVLMRSDGRRPHVPDRAATLGCRLVPVTDLVMLAAGGRFAPVPGSCPSRAHHSAAWRSRRRPGDSPVWRYPHQHNELPGRTAASTPARARVPARPRHRPAEPDTPRQSSGRCWCGSLPQDVPDHAHQRLLMAGSGGADGPCCHAVRTRTGAGQAASPREAAPAW